MSPIRKTQLCKYFSVTGSEIILMQNQKYSSSTLGFLASATLIFFSIHVSCGF